MPTDPAWQEDGHPRGEIWNAIVSACHTRGIDAQQAEDVAFHMTDWLRDFEQLKLIFENSGSIEPARLAEMLNDLLIHVPNHLAAASVLFTGQPVRDIFEVGAVGADEE